MTQERRSSSPTLGPPAYAELVCRSNYSFLRGASAPEALVERAAALGLWALALTDDDGLYGAVKAHLQAKASGLRFVVGASLTLTDAPPLRLYAADARGYEHLCELISESRLAHPKGGAGLPWRRVLERTQGLYAIAGAEWGDALDVSPAPGRRDGARPSASRAPPSGPPPGELLREAFGARLSVGLSRHLERGDEARVALALTVSRRWGVPLVAHNDVHTHERARQPLQDVVTAIRLGVPVASAGAALFPNAERTLKGPAEVGALFADVPEALERSVEIAEACTFSLDALRYGFSREELPPGLTPARYLAQLVAEGLRRRYPGGVPEAVAQQIAKELTLIGALGYEGYFLALWDIVRFARERGILCQGRGSAANSAVCYALEITAIDPVRMGLLFERFLSMERREPPDIDVDFEHHRREEVLQYVYAKHGRHRAAMVCEHLCFRERLALREVGKALGLSLDQVDRLAKAVEHGEDLGARQLRDAGLSPEHLAAQQTLALARALVGTPRHLSIHVGGFVITHERLCAMVPVENAAMEGRTVVQWEKDDLSALDILKVDLLSLGTLTVVRRTFELVAETTGRRFDMATVPAEDSAVYEMLCAGDSVGVFQIESRAQQNMLPRLKPRTFYDLVVQIAIIRPGPIVGDMVHPYLRRRDGLEPVDYPSEDVRAVLGRTLGIPLFQEQAMRLAMVVAGFSAGEADRLRRALSHKHADSKLQAFRGRFVEGCVAHGYERAFAERCFDRFKGFAHYGFPESHSASFALIAYVTSWLKRYYPAAFCAALLDAQPMGFYAPHTLVEDARRHGVVVRPVDVNASRWGSTLELPDGPEERAALAAEPNLGRTPLQPALRLGFERVKGLERETARRIEGARAAEGPFGSVAELARRTRVPRHELTRLALAGALAPLCSGRREALWAIAALGSFDEGDLFFGVPMAHDAAALPEMTLLERLSTDFDAVGLSVEAHPVVLVRPELDRLGALSAARLQRARAGQRVRVGGLVIVRQRPPTAKGFTFLSVEDETGIANLVLDPRRSERFRRVLATTGLVVGEGRVERAGAAVNVKVELLSALAVG